jgi:glucokinase
MVKKTKSTKYVLGIDLGGTNVMAVIVTTAGKVIASSHFPTEGEKGPDYVVKNMADKVKEMVKKAGMTMKDIWRAGVGSPGPMDSKKGIIMGAVNLPGWKRVTLKADLEKYLGIGVGVDNDANCAVYGEKWAGAAKGASNVVGLTLGTGVGGGIIIDDKLVRGANYNAGEIGHTTLNPDGIQCKCGAKGCIERYASASAIAEAAREAIRKGARSIMTEFVKGDLNKLTSKTVYEAMMQNDKTAVMVWDDFIKYLGAAVANQINGLNPEVVVIAGGVINAGEKLFKPLKEAVRKQTFAITFSAAKIVPAKLGELAGAIGAAGLVINEGGFYNL